MLRLSIIIPLEHNSGLLEECLVSVLENRPNNCEVLVVLDTHYDNPYDLDDEVTFIDAKGANLAAAYNAGLRAAQGEFVHFIRCGVEATPNWTEAALAALGDPSVVAVSPAIHLRQDPQQALARGISVKRGIRQLAAPGRKSSSVGPSMLGGFYRRQALLEMGGFNERMGNYADADLLLRLQQQGGKSVATADSVLLARQQKPARGFKHGLHSQRLFLKHRNHLGWLARLAHPFHVTADCCRHLPNPLAAITSLIGRAWACLEHIRSGNDSSANPQSGSQADASADELKLPGRSRIDPPHGERRRSESRVIANNHERACELR